MISSIIPLIYDSYEQRIAILDTRAYLGSEIKFKEQETKKFDISIFSCPLLEGEYSLGLYIKDRNIEKDILDIFKFTILPSKIKDDTSLLDYDHSVKGVINLKFKITQNDIIL